MHVLVTFKNEEDQIKYEGAGNESARVVTTLNINITDAQGQLTV